MIARLFAAVALFLAQASFAQPLTLIVTSGPGSLSDTAARFVAPLLERELGRPVVVDNRPGAMGLVGLRAFHGAPKDALLVAGTQVAYIAKTNPQADFDPVREFEPLHGLVETPQLLLVPATSALKKPADLKGMALNGGSSHPSTQMSMEMLDAKLGTKTTVVSYKQAAQLVVDLAAGRVDYTFGGAGNGATAGLIQSGQLRVIARAKDLGVEEFSWLAFFAHASAPAKEKSALTQAIRKAMHAAEWKDAPHTRLGVDAGEIRSIVSRELKLIPAP